MFRAARKSISKELPEGTETVYFGGRRDRSVKSNAAASQRRGGASASKSPSVGKPFLIYKSTKALTIPKHQTLHTSQRQEKIALQKLKK